MTSGLRVQKAGILTLLQDNGRFGYQHLGLTTGGVADEHASLWANRLLDNRAQAQVLECCFGGLSLQAEQPITIALTGAEMQARINHKPISNWSTHQLQSGDQLHLGHARNGVRAYLAVKGGFDIVPTLGSVSTVMREKIGGVDGAGSPVKKGDHLPCPVSEQKRQRQVPDLFIPDYAASLIAGMIPAAGDLFSDIERQRFFNAAWRITSNSNSMGIRLQGPPIQPRQNGIVSEATHLGAIQIPPDGQPVILLKDRQTMGGYPVIGSVFSLDTFLLAQKQAHSTVRFEPVDLDEAQATQAAFRQFFGQ